jgi:protein-tyrosine phosphatase
MKEFDRLARYRGLTAAACLTLASAICGVPPCHAQAAPAPAIPFETADVSSRDGQAFVVSWRAPGVHQVQVFAGNDPTHVGRDRLVAKGPGTGEITVADLPAAPRWYFQLVPDHGEPLVIADRSLHLTTAANFRDAGGYRTADGKWVRMGLVYRSNGIEHLSDGELSEIDRLNLKLVCDLRTAEEIRRGPDRVPQGATEVSADVLADDADLIHNMLAGGTATPQAPPNAGTAATPQAPPNPGAGPSLEHRIYRDFVRLSSAQKAYGSLFERLSDPSTLPTVFHCTAGKDRTGWAEAVFLTILGVPRPTVVRDYELTNEYLQGDALKSVRQSTNQATAARLRADPAALDAAFDEVTRDYGSFDNYLRHGLHLSEATLSAIRKNFLAG